MRLTAQAMSPCTVCGRAWFDREEADFYRFQIQACSIDAHAVAERVGMALHLSEGPRTCSADPEPVVVSGVAEITVCQTCMASGNAMTLKLGGDDDALTAIDHSGRAVRTVCFVNPETTVPALAEPGILCADEC